MKKFLLFVTICLMFAAPVMAATIVDTGAGNSLGSGGYTLSTSQWLAAEFDLDQDYHITGLYGWMANNNQTGKHFTISIYGDGGEIPDTSNLLYSNSAMISGTNGQANWEGYDITWTDANGNTGQFLTAGTYWIAFELRTINYSDPYAGYMPNDAPNELGNEAFNSTGSWSEHDDLSLGVQVFGTAAPVPEPTAMILFGFGLLGLVGVSRRKK